MGVVHPNLWIDMGGAFTFDTTFIDMGKCFIPDGTVFQNVNMYAEHCSCTNDP